MIDKAFSAPKCVWLVRISQHSNRWLKKMWCAIPGPRLADLSDIWGEEHLNLERENCSDFEKQSKSGKVPKDAPTVDEID